MPSTWVAATRAGSFALYEQLLSSAIHTNMKTKVPLILLVARGLLIADIIIQKLDKSAGCARESVCICAATGCGYLMCGHFEKA